MGTARADVGLARWALESEEASDEKLRHDDPRAWSRRLEDPIANEGTRGLEAEPVMTSGPVE
jgi:hypothetical protein